MLNLNVVDTRCLNFLIKNQYFSCKAVKLLRETSFTLQTSLLSNLAVLFQFPLLDQFWGLATKFPNTHFAFDYWQSRFQESWASLVFCLSYKATFYLFKLKRFIWNHHVWFCKHFTKIIVKKPTQTRVA